MSWHQRRKYAEETHTTKKHVRRTYEVTIHNQVPEMSVFNTRKDRERNGKPKPHYHVGYPGFEGKMMHHRNRTAGCWPDWNARHCPSARTRMFITRPRRAKESAAIARIMKGADPDGVLFPRPRKPYIYYY